MVGPAAGPKPVCCRFAAESTESAGSPFAEEFASLGWDSPALEIGRGIDRHGGIVVLPAHRWS